MDSNMLHTITPTPSHSRLRAAVVVALLTAAVMTFFAATSQAATYSVVGTLSNGLNVRSTPHLGAPLVTNLRDGTQINIVCQTRGDNVVASTMWDRVNQPVAGYVADYYTTTPVVNNPSPGLPDCTRFDQQQQQQQQPSQQQPAPNYAELRNRASVRCLDADANTISRNGTLVHLWACSGHANQNWLSASDGTIRNRASGRCLDADANTIQSIGTKVQLWDCNGTSRQRWTVNSDGTIRNVASGRCLDADGWTINSTGTKITLWSCNGGRNQNWYRAEATGLVHLATKRYCPSLFSDLNFAPCLTATAAWDGTSAAPRSVQVAGCEFKNGFEESLTCTGTHTESSWSGTANVDSATISATLTESTFIYGGGLYTCTTYLYYNWTVSVSTSPNGAQQVSYADGLGGPGGDGNCG